MYRQHPVSVRIVRFVAAALPVVWGQHAAGGAVMFRSCLQGSTATHEYRMSKVDCIDECQLQTRCKSVNYHARSQRCDLNDGDESTGGTIADCPGYVYVAKSGMEPSSRLGSCVAHTCDDRTRCRDTGASGATCVYAVCDDIPAPSRGVVLGNRRQVGARVALECDPGVTLTGPRTAVCQDDGSWSPLGQCGSSTCGLPPPVPGADVWSGIIITTSFITYLGPHDDTSLITVVDIMAGSNVIYTCPANSHMVGSNTTTCTDGVWTQAPECRAGGGSTMFTQCNDNDDCLDTDSECRGGVCWCVPGRSYTPSTNSCVTHCAVYGTTFQYVEKMEIPDNDVVIYHGLDNETNCDQLCLAYVGCKSYENKTAWCALQTVVAFDTEVTFTPKEPIDYHQRDCAENP